MLSGYDHLAFVFGIIFFLTRFKDIVKYITAFTLGHSVTLILATFKGIQVNYFLVDAVIALSVCYIAFHNLGGFKKYLNIKPPNLMVMIIGLGLVHGLGLSTRLQQLPLSEDRLLMNIISFNVGIEVGQIGALALMLIFMSVFRKSNAFPAFSRIANYFLILAGGSLFLMQVYGYVHAGNPDESIASTEPSRRVGALSKHAVRSDSISVTVPPGSDLEYSVRMLTGAHLDYTWEATKGEKLYFDLHGEPAGATAGYFESFEKGMGFQRGGSLKATFDGTHGWYWVNYYSAPVVVMLKIKGEYELLDSTGYLPP
jgi:hypothetical protein